MIVTLLIVSVSVLLFVYWFRYTVLLIQSRPAPPEFAHKVAAANHLSFVEVRRKIHDTNEATSLRTMCQSLERDYWALKYLLGHAATVQAGSYTAEQRLLMINFRLLRLWFAAVLRFRPGAAKVALLEMSGTLEYFAGAMGRRFASLTGEPGGA